MKILYFSPHPNLNLSSPAGYGTHMRGTINAMRELGHEVIVCIAGGEKEGSNGGVVKSSKWKKYIPNLIKQTLKDYLLLRLNTRHTQQLQNLITQHQPDLVYERSYYLMNAGVLVAKKMDIKHFLEVNAPFIQEKIEMEGPSLLLHTAKKIEQQKADKTDRLIVVSSALKNHFVAQFGIDQDKIKVCPNGINSQDWIVDDKQTNKLQKELRLETTDYVIGFVGSILPHHGIHDLIHAFEKSKQAHWKLLIVGDGETMPTLKNAVAKLNIADQVIFTGNVPFEHVKNYMALFSVGVMPASNWYGSPVKIFEYGAVGIPVIAPNNEPVNDVMQNGKQGLLINNAKELEKALTQLQKNDDNSNMANAWQTEVLTRYTWKQLTEKSLLD
jgi:glycosyltransferase involved in cell wall biosynthesis